MWTISFKVVIEFVTYDIASVLYSGFFGLEAFGTLSSPPGIEPAPPALEGEVLTTGLPGKSLHFKVCGSLSTFTV